MVDFYNYPRVKITNNGTSRNKDYNLMPKTHEPNTRFYGTFKKGTSKNQNLQNNNRKLSTKVQEVTEWKKKVTSFGHETLTKVVSNF